MYTDTTPKEMPTGDCNPAAGHADNLTVPKPPDTDKVFHSLKAAFALHGHARHRTNPDDGAVTYWAELLGLVRYLPSIATARRFPEQIGGRL